MKQIHTVGTRKSAVARATLYQGSGIVRVNSQLLSTFNNDLYKSKIEEPLIIAGDVAKKVDFKITLNGGGVNSRAEATRLAIAKALAIYDKKLHKQFLEYDRTLSVADVRQKETHKPNRHGKARSKVQKSYR